MIVGHLPAGYVLSKFAYARFSRAIGSYRIFMFWGLFGAIAPDLDMFYFHLIDHGRIHHHKYFSHFPILWLSLITLSAGLFVWKTKRYTVACYALIFSISGFIHLVLDTIVGDIWWLAPFVDQPFAFASVTARFHPWWLNFILHWSFAIELVIVGWAILKWRRNAKNFANRAPKKLRLCAVLRRRFGADNAKR